MQLVLYCFAMPCAEAHDGVKVTPPMQEEPRYSVGQDQHDIPLQYAPLNFVVIEAADLVHLVTRKGQGDTLAHSLPDSQVHVDGYATSRRAGGDES